MLRYLLPYREFYLPFEVLTQILDNEGLGKRPLLLSKRLGQTLYPRLHPRLAPLYNPPSETYLLSDLSRYDGSFSSANQWVIKGDKIEFSFYYCFDPYESDTYWLNNGEEKAEQLRKRLAPVYCPVSGMSILQKRVEFFNQLFFCTIASDEVRNACAEEILGQLAERDLRKNLCYILMVASTLGICPARYHYKNKDCWDEVVHIRQTYSH